MAIERLTIADYNNLENKPNIPSKTSDLTNDSGFITSIPQATRETLGGVKVGSGLNMDDNGTLSKEPIEYIDGAFTGMFAESANEYGIGIYSDAIDIGANQPSFNATLPIVAGDGISIDINENNKAEISNIINKTARIDTWAQGSALVETAGGDGIEWVDKTIFYGENDEVLLSANGQNVVPIVAGDRTYIKVNENNKAVIDAKRISTLNTNSGDVTVTAIDEDGIFCEVFETEIETVDEDENYSYDYAHGTFGVPIVAGSGISIDVNENNKAEIGVSDIPTTKLFKDVAVMDIGYERDITDIYINDGIQYRTETLFMDEDDGVLSSFYTKQNLPIVAGKGITITKNDNNRAEISSTLNKNGTNGYIDTYFNDVDISENGIYTYGNIEITDGDDNLVDTIGSNVTLPIVTGEGISITKNSNNKAEIGVDDIPTSKLFKDVNEVEIGYTNINNLYYSNAGIVYFSDVSFMDDNGGDLAKTTAYHRLPIVAGEGISIAENSDRTKAMISAKGLATESYVDTKVANLVNSAPETLNTLSELATAIQNHEDEYDALLETVGNKANKSEVPTKTSQLTNDSGFLTSAPVTSVNGSTGAVTISDATTSASGLMSSSDKSKLDGIASGAQVNKNPTSASMSSLKCDSFSSTEIGLTGGKLNIKYDDNTSAEASLDVALPLVEGKGILFGTSGDSVTIQNTAPIYFVPTLTVKDAGSSTSGARLATKWAVNGVEGITKPANGMMIAIRTPNAGISGGVLLSIDNGTTYYPVVRNVSSMITTHYGLGTTLILAFNNTQAASVYATSETLTEYTGCWQVADYDSNTKTTAGTSNKVGTKMFLVGGTSQSSSGVTTYSNKNVYIGTDNCLYSNSSKVLTEGAFSYDANTKTLTIG